MCPYDWTDMTLVVQPWREMFVITFLGRAPGVPMAQPSVVKKHVRLQLQRLNTFHETMP
jgi:hypothetical protein